MQGDRRWKLVGSTLVLSIVVGSSGVAQADTARAPGTAVVAVAMDHPGRANLARADQATSRYTDLQVLEFLVLAEGPIAADHPRLAGDLGFVPAGDSVDRPAARQLMEDYLASHADFHTRVALPVQSGDPKRVDAALEHFASSFNDYVQKLYRSAAKPSGDMSGQGWAYTATWAVTAGWLAAAAGAVVYGGVAGFHAAVAVTVIVYVYLPGAERAPTSIERDTLVQAVSTALGG